MTLLKADLHIHTSEDPEDFIRYSAMEIIEMAHDRGYSILAITNHNSLTYSDYIRDFALERGIILIPGMEATIQGRHVLVYNMNFDRIQRNDIRSIRALKRPDNLVIAPHPYYPSIVALRGLFKRHIELFDAVEQCHFYSEHMDFNRPAIRMAAERNLPVIGSSDAHQKRQVDTTYSLIDSEPDLEAVINAIKEGKVRVVSRPLPLSMLLRIKLKMTWRNAVLKRFAGR